MEVVRGVEVIRGVLKMAKGATNFYRTMAKVKPISGGNGKCVCELVIEDEHTNPGGSLHGGYTATLIDTVSTAALKTVGTGEPGVSVDMNITYVRRALVGETIVISADVIKTGRLLAFTTVDIRRKSDNAQIALGRHTKAYPLKKPPEYNNSDS